MAFKNSRAVKGCMTGLRPVAVGLICGAAVTIAAEVFSFGKIEILLGKTLGFSNTLTISPFTTAAFWCSLALCVVATVLGFKKVHPILIITLSAAVGIGLGYLGVWG
jgi:chromate transporter